jgi:hypothetical protein
VSVVVPFAATDPTLSILTWEALRVVHESVVADPWVIELGLAVSVQVGAEGGTTVTVATQLTEPPAPLATRVYVAVFAGVTSIEPFAPGETAVPLIATFDALDVVQVSFEVPPETTEFGDAESVQVGAAGARVTTIVVLQHSTLLPRESVRVSV